MSLDTQGFAELAGQIERMANRLNTDEEGAPTAKRILQAAAEPIHQQMKANASSDPKIITGALHGAINIGKVKKRKSGGQHITIGVHRKDWSNPDYVPAYVEYGHGGPGPAPAHPYIRPAYDTRQDEAYGAKVWHSNDMYRRVIWQCNRKFSKTQEQCKTPHLTEDTIKEMFLKAYNRLMRQRKQLIEDCELMKSLLTDCAEQEAGMEQLRQEIEEIADMTQNLVRQNTRQTQSQEAYNAKYNALAERYEKASAKHGKLEAEVARRKNKARQIAAFIDQLEKAPASLEEWDCQVWSLLLEKGTVNRDGNITFEFRNGKEIKVEAK